MKKLLSATLALAIGATCIGMLAACNTSNDENDAEKAKEAIKNVRSTYIESPKKTDSSYELISQVKIKDGSAYDVSWTVNPAATCTIENFSSYVSVGAVNENKKVPVSITKADVAIEYELKASVTVGSATETVKFDREVSAKPVEHDGTLENPFSVANVIDMCTGEGEGKLAAGQYYGGNDNPTLVYVKGYLVDISRADTSNASRVNYLYIVDDYVDGKGSKDGDAVCVYSCNYGDKLKSKDDLEEGAEIVVAGYIMHYKPNTGNSFAEVNYWKDSAGTYHDVTCVEYNKIEKTDAQKAQSALDAFKKAYDGKTVYSNLSLDSSVADVTLTIENSTATGVIALDGTVTLPASNTEVTLTVKATCGTETPTTTVTVTVPKLETFEEGTYKVAVDFANATDSVVNGKKRYFKGTINTDEYGETSEDESEAAVVTVEAVTGGYTLKVGDQYLELYTNADSKVRPTLTTTPSATTKWVYNGELKVFTWTIGTKTYYLGCYTNTKTNQTYTTISASETTYISGDNKENVGKTQFPIGFEKTVVGPDTRDDDAKITAALGDVKLNDTYKAGVVNLPKTNNGANLSWVVTEGGDVASIETNADGVQVLTITNPESSDSGVTLTVTISCGSGTPQSKPVSFTVTYVAPVNYGDIDHPLSVTEAVDNHASKLSASAWTEEVVWMKGIVVSTPAISSNGSYYQTFSIKDESNTPDAKTIQVYSINLRSGSNVAPPVQNDVVTISGYITNYNGNTKQFSRNTNVTPTVEVYLEKNVRGTSTITLGDHGDATVADLPTTETNGEEVTFTVTVPTTKKIDAVKVGGVAIEGTDGTYKFTVAGNATVTVETSNVNDVTASPLYTLTQAANSKNNNYAGNSDIVCGGITWNVGGNGSMNPWRFGGGKTTGLNHVDRYLTGKTAISGKVTLVDINISAVSDSALTVDSVTLKVYESDPTADGATAISTVPITYDAGNVVTVKADKEWKDCYYQIVFQFSNSGTSNQYVTISSLVFRGFAA